MDRLIYADALIHSICRKCNDVNYDDPCEPSDCAIYYAVQNAPTVDAVPVVHGRWVAVPSSDMMTGKAYKCSQCGKMRYGSFMPNYCQCCGAKMNLEG